MMLAQPSWLSGLPYESWHAAQIPDLWRSHSVSFMGMLVRNNPIQFGEYW